MCGIAGVLTLDGRPADPDVARVMATAIAHRGPDGEGHWHDGPIALAHRRLAIRDLSPAGMQPYHSACGRVVVVYNGEIYNEKPLRTELERRHGLISRSTTDTEIIPAGYLAWGMALFERLEGIFAIALWDRVEQRLVLARDRVGVKPLYVQRDATTLRFGSETKALLADTGWRASIDLQRLHTLLALGHLGPADSLIAGAEQVPPGAIRVIGRDSDRTTTFWRPSRRPGKIQASDAIQAMVELLPRVVEDQLVSDVPIGVLQSGGIDSTLLTLSLPGNVTPSLFTLRFAEQSYDETALASAVATHASRPHIVVDLPDDTDAETTFRDTVHHLDGELADSSAFAAYQLAHEVRKHVTVALAGDGGDEIFAGYPTYRATLTAARLAPILRFLPMHSIGRVIRRVAGMADERVPLTEKIARFCLGCTASAPHVTWRRYLEAHEAVALYGSRLAPVLEAGNDPLAGYADALLHADGNIVDRSLLADQCYYLPADMLTKVDRTSMAFGLEIRVPLLDRRIIELAASIPSHVLYPPFGPTKAILRGTARALGAPATIIGGPKRGFNVPINRLLSGPLHHLAQRLLEIETDIFAPFLRPDAVREMWRKHKSRQIDHGYVIWTLLTLAVRREQLGSRLSDA